MTTRNKTEEEENKNEKVKFECLYVYTDERRFKL